jgi:sterol desaturase/sphingolipid hydroxylase (fatty acid hydroxylase superfamily)
MYNILISGTGVLHYYVLLDGRIWVLFLFAFLRNFAASHLIEWVTQTAPLLNTNYRYPSDVPYIHYMVQAAALEAVTLPFIHTVSTNVPWTILTFIPISFLFEVIFDFFHYWSHRYLHQVSWSWHTDHHRHIHLRPQLTFHHHITDLVLSNVVPFMSTVWIFHVAASYSFSLLEIALLISYKVFIEIAGHAGRSSNRTTSFPQCIWLPRALGIELHAEDHNLHHVRPLVNYSKRFTLWDRVFGTYALPAGTTGTTTDGITESR